MDELVIEDKKYISSKRAANITGYAKDYVGQLAREGYVEARRVGRNWYVLESAIKDHRFGNPTESGSQEPRQEAKSEARSVTNTWEAPRYTPVEAGHLPSINRLRSDPEPILGRTEPVPVEETRDSSRPLENLQDTWQAWFDSFGARESDKTIPVPERTDESVQEPPEAIPDGVVVPLHRFEEHTRLSVPHSVRPATRFLLEKPSQSPQPQRSSGRVSYFALQTALAVVALFFACAAVFGSGYFDTNPISSGQLHLISGMAAVEKASK